MSGRRVRRPAARQARQPARRGAGPARRAAEGDGARAVQRKVLAVGLAILLAGTTATFLLEQAVLAPRRQVQAASALPVYSAVGQRTDDVSFWPWTFYAEHAGQSPTLLPTEDQPYLREEVSALAGMLLDGAVEVDDTGRLVESFSEQTASCLYLRDVPLVWTPPEGGVQNLTLDLGVGGGSDPALSYGMAVSVVLKTDQAPTEAQLEAAYRQVLLELCFQCGAAGWLLDAAAEVTEATPAPADAPSEPSGQMTEPPALSFSDGDSPLSEEAQRRLQKAAQLSLGAVMDRMSQPMGELAGIDETMLMWPTDLGPDTSLWPPDNTPDLTALAAGTLSQDDTRKLEQRLQQQYAEYGIELQVVTLSDSVLVLLSAAGFTLGLYYSPVLETWCGMAIQ